MERGVLDDLAAFTVVARERSFTRAAAHLGMSTSMLSYAIKRLETRIGLRLLQRNSRTVAVTEIGDRLLQTLNPALESIDTVFDELNRDRGDIAGTVKITATRQAYEAVIRPVLTIFAERHPNASIEVLIEYEFRDIIAGRLDAGIRLGEKLEQDMIAIKVSSDLRMAVVASPAYVAEHGEPETPRDLRRHRCIGFRMRAGGAIIGWDFEHDGQELEVKIEGPLIVNEPELATDAALDGLGIAYVLEDRAAPYLSDGRLIRMMEEWTPPFPGFFLYYPSRRQMPPTLGAFIALLRQRRFCQRAFPERTA